MREDGIASEEKTPFAGKSLFPLAPDHFSRKVRDILFPVCSVIVHRVTANDGKINLYYFPSIEI